MAPTTTEAQPNPAPPTLPPFEQNLKEDCFDRRKDIERVKELVMESQITTILDQMNADHSAQARMAHAFSELSARVQIIETKVLGFDVQLDACIEAMDRSASAHGTATPWGRSRSRASRRGATPSRAPWSRPATCRSSTRLGAILHSAVPHEWPGPTGQ